MAQYERWCSLPASGFAAYARQPPKSPRFASVVNGTADAGVLIGLHDPPQGGGWVAV